MEDKEWENFLKTGSVENYLRYKRHDSRNLKEEFAEEIGIDIDVEMGERIHEASQGKGYSNKGDTIQR